MEEENFRKRFTATELTAIYADSESGGELKKVLSKIEEWNLNRAAYEAVKLCRASFSPNTDPLFFDREFLYHFLTTMRLEDEIRSNFVDVDEIVARCNPALAYCIHDNDHWMDIVDPIWLSCAEDVGWDGVMPVKVLHRFNEGGMSRMVAYRDSPIWRRIGFAPQMRPDEKRELFPFVADWRVRKLVCDIEKREVRKMYVRVGLPDPIREIDIRISRFPKYKRIESDEAADRDLAQAVRAHADVIDDLEREIREREDAYVYGPDPARFDPPPPRKAPIRSYALDAVKKEIDEGKRIIARHSTSVKEKCIGPVEKLRCRYAQKLAMTGGNDSALIEAIAAIENAKVKFDGLLSVLSQCLEGVLTCESEVGSDPMPTQIEKWAGFESRMYQRLQDASSAHAAATEAYRERAAVKDELDATLRSLGLKK